MSVVAEVKGRPATSGPLTTKTEIPTTVTTSTVPPGPDLLIERVRQAQALVQTVEEQVRAVEAAYERGWRDAGNALAKFAASEYERGWDEGRAVGYYRANLEADERWTEVARQAHYLGSPESKTYDQLTAVRAGIPWSLVKNWPITSRYGITEAEWLQYHDFVTSRTQAKQVAA